MTTERAPMGVLIAHLDSNIVSRGRRHGVRVAPTVAELIFALIEAGHTGLDADAIAKAVWGGQWSNRSRGSVANLIVRARAALHHLGAEIENHGTRGRPRYRIERSALLPPRRPRRAPVLKTRGAA
jgi:hypothetical protein